MKIWEAVAMLQEMDQTKECTVTFGPGKKQVPFSGIPCPTSTKVYSPTHTKVVSPTYYEQFNRAAGDWINKDGKVERDYTGY